MKLTFHRSVPKLLFVFLFFIIAGCSHAPEPIPPQGGFARWHPAYQEYEKFLAQHPSSNIIEKNLSESWIVTPYKIVGKNQFLAIPPSMPPSKRAIALIERWPHAIYAQLIDDVRVLACFDDQDRLVAYELF